MSIRRIVSSTLLPKQTKRFESFLRTCFNHPTYKLDSRYYSHIYVATDSTSATEEVDAIVPIGMLCVRHCTYMMMLQHLDDECERQKNGSAVSDVARYFNKPSTCEVSLWNLCVVPERRRQKIAEQLMLTCIRDNVHELSDYNSLRFELYVSEENVAAKRLYDKLGFKAEARDTRHNAVLLKMYKSFVFGMSTQDKPSDAVASSSASRT